MDINQILQMILIFVTIIIACFGFVFTFIQIRQSSKAKKAELIYGVICKIRSDQNIYKAIYSIDYSLFSYDSSFHGSQAEISIDALFAQMNYVCYLLKFGLFSKSEFSIFEYEIMRISQSKGCMSYLWNLYHWSKKQSSFPFFTEYLLEKMDSTSFSQFNSSDPKISGFQKYLNF
jgi:hypothetical protein